MLSRDARLQRIARFFYVRAFRDCGHPEPWEPWVKLTPVKRRQHLRLAGHVLDYLETEAAGDHPA